MLYFKIKHLVFYFKLPGLLSLAVYLLIHGFIFWRLERVLTTAAKPRLLLALGVLGSGLVIFFIPYPFLLSIWLGVISITLTLFMLEWFVSLFYRKGARIRVILVLMASLILSLYAIYSGGQLPVIRTVTIPVNNLPAAAENFRILQISDLHLRGSIPQSWLDGFVERVRAARADLIAITGDLNNGHIDRRCHRLLTQLPARYGIVAVTGNHEYGASWLGARPFRKMLRYSPVKLLENRMIRIQGIQVAGVNDRKAAGYDFEAKQDLVRAVAGADSELPLLLLSHRPNLFSQAAAMGVDLQLSGHSHGGQVPPQSIFIQLFRPRSHGLSRKGNAWLYASSGANVWAHMPLRLFTRNEIVVFVLVRDKEKTTVK